jgi:hypothetical protein
MRDHASLAGAGSRKNQQWSFGVLYGVALSRVERGKQIQNFLFYRDALCEVPRLIDIAASSDSDVVRQQLQWKCENYGHQERRCCRN